MLKGNQPSDGGGLILDRRERDELLAGHPEAARFIRRYLGSQEILKGIERWCLWIEDADLELALSVPFIASRLQIVRAMRLSSDTPTTSAAAARPNRFIQIQDYGKDAVVVPRNTSERRQHVPVSTSTENCIVWLYFHTGRIADRILHPQEMIDIWVARHSLVDDPGQPLPLLLSRLRKTHKALWYAKTQGDMARFAIGHTPEVAARHYADLPSLRHLHEQTIADGLNDALTSALQPRIVTPEEEAAAHRAPSTLQLPIPAAEVRRVLAGKQDVWLASCSGFHNSPFATEGEPCSEPFWGCLECRNAVITARKLPSIIAFLDFIVARRAGMDEADWQAKFGRAWSRITRQVLPAFSDVVVAEAREKAKALDHQPYLPLEARA